MDEKFRLEIAKRLGMKKGNLTKALEEAMELWIENPIIEGLKSTAMNGRLLPNERERATDALGEIGYSAIPSLNEIANYSRLLPNEREKATMLIQKILKNQKSQRYH